MKKNNKLSDLLNKKGFYVGLYSCAAIIVAIAGVISYSNINSMKAPEDDKTPVPQMEMANQSNVKSYHLSEAETQAQEKSSEAETKKQETKTSDSEKAKEPSSEEKAKTTQNEEKVFSLFDESQEMSWPVSGKIVMDYSMDTAIYDKTLDQYRTNDSVCISVPEGTSVKASAEGIVESIVNDHESGETVVINHGNGWKSTYSQLDNNVLVKEGDVVKEGTVIGSVGTPTKYSVLLGSHLDFKVSKDDSFTDPKMVLAQFDE